VTLMGIATAGVGLMPPASTIGYAAPALVIFLRILQGLALGGEYGGAAVYVAEHAGPSRRGFFTSFIQSSVVGGFVLSLVVVLACKGVMSAETWAAWGWRVPFLLSLLLLAGLAVDAAEAFGKPGVQGDEGKRRTGRQSLHREHDLPRQPGAVCSWRCSAWPRG